MIHLIAVGCPLLSIYALNEYLLWPRKISHSVLLVAAVFALSWLGRLFFQEKDRRLQRFALIFGFSFALAQICGARLDNAGTIVQAGTPLRSMILMLFASITLAPSAGGILIAMVHWIRNVQSTSGPQKAFSEKKVFWISFAIIMLCWLPALLAYWPGIYSYDVTRQIEQTVTGNYIDHDPVFHTLLIGGFHALGTMVGSPNCGIALYCIFQMSSTALTLAFILRYLVHLHSPRWFVVSLLLLFSFAPFYQLLAISTTKDILFTNVLAVWAVIMAWGLGEPKVTRNWSWKAGWLVSATLVGLLRTNGILAIATVLAGGVVLLRRNRVLCKRILCLTLCALVMYTATHEVLVKVLDADAGPFHEVLNVPIQQIARVNHILKYESRDEILEWLPDVRFYQPALTDYVKHTADIEPYDLPSFLGLWARLGMKFPVIYLDAFGFLTKGYWHLDDLSHATFRGELLEYHEGYLGTIFRADYGVTQQSLWPELYDWYEQMYSVNRYLNIPFLSVITGTALWCWLQIALLMVSLYLRRKETTLPLLMGWALYLMFLLIGPCCIIRYVYPFIFIVSLCLGVLLAPLPSTQKDDIIKSNN